MQKALGWTDQQMHPHKRVEFLGYRRSDTFLLRSLCLASILVVSSMSPVRAIQAEPEGDRSLTVTPLAESFQETPILLSQSFDGSTLQLGDSGDAVSQLQIRLAELGYFQGSPSGIFGPATEAAVIQFQQNNGLVADGVVGPATQSSLGVAVSQSTSTDVVLQIGSSGEAVTQLQSRLAELGYFQGSPTGNFSPATEAAVIQFQQANGLVADGVVGIETANTLYGTVSPALPPAQTAAPVQTFNPVASANDGILQLGDVGPDVTDLQRRLNNLGYYQGPIDGDFGPGTQAAVIQFQQRNELVADGIAGPLTLSTISNASPGGSSAQRPPASQVPSAAGQPSGRFSVLELQRRLQRRGFYSGPLDGELGTGTRQAISAAQRAYGLSADDILNGRFR